MNQVLALKYRPKRFEDLIGQKITTQTLSLALDTKRLSHAYLLSGLRGSGKTSTARILAKSLLCDNGPTSNPCEVCPNCISSNEGKHLDIIEMDAASNRGIDDIKELIEHIKYQPSSARFKVFIIDEIHMLTTQAFNALLKTLEEPPSFVKFILATTDPLKLPATILSRAQHFRFNKISQKYVMQHLIHILNLEKIDFDNEALNIIARHGQGSLRDTLTTLDQAIIFSKGKINTPSVIEMLGLLDSELLDKVFNIILNQDNIQEAVNILNSHEASFVLDELLGYIKDKMMSKDPRFDILHYDRYFRILADAKYLLHLNSDGEFVIILTLLKMFEATNLHTIDEIMDEIEHKEINLNNNVINQKQDNKTNNDSSNKKIITNNSHLMYKELTSKIYEKNYELGKCFENNFHFISFETNKLLIKSSAKGECKKILWKDFSHIRYLSESIFGHNIEIDFQKIENNNNSNKINQTDNIDNTQVEPENVASSSCMENIIERENTNVSEAQNEYETDDIEQSEMVKMAKKLFKPTNTKTTTKS